jgi:hypothetical protein
MDQSNGWGLPRYVTLLVVLAFHVGLLAAILMASPTYGVSAQENQAVELLFLPPANPPKIRFENARPRRLSANPEITITPPLLDPNSTTASPSGNATAGNGPGVDWKAEARRAVQAFEIRNGHPPSNLLSGSPAEENWWPRGRHHAGDSFKTASGDWIVWISDSCYQIARSAANAAASGAVLPQTVCVRESAAARGESGAAPNKTGSQGVN